jgi:hypothetical protein
MRYNVCHKSMLPNLERGKTISFRCRERLTTPTHLFLPLASNTPNFCGKPETRSKPNQHRVLIVVITILVCTNLFTFLLLLTSSNRSLLISSDLPTGAPMLLSQLPLIETPKLFNATLHHPLNTYRFHCSPVADRAWSDLISDTGVLLVQKGDKEAAGIEPDRHVYWDEPKKGLVGYPVVVESVHQLHCLDLLRQHSCYIVEWTR